MTTKTDPLALPEKLEAAWSDAIEARAASKGFSVVNADGADDKPAVVRIYDRIGGFFGLTASDVVEQLDEITAEKIRVEINSPGGSVFDGIAIYNALRSHPAHVTTRADGLAASIASVIFQAGDHRVMQPASQMMIHRAWGAAVGHAGDMASFAEVLEQQDSVIAGIYASHSDNDADHFHELMNAETWLTDARAVEEGLADEVADLDPDPDPDSDDDPDAGTSTDPVAGDPAADPKNSPEPSPEPEAWTPPVDAAGRDWVREYVNA